MRNALVIVSLLLHLVSASQKRSGKTLSFAVTNNHTAYPFASFSKLLTGPVHPGFEAGYEFNWSAKAKHDWFQAFKVGYFYHRFVQHGIPLYTQFGYRYKWSPDLRTTASLGAGYMHAIPATAVLEMNSTGDYKNGKGIGRGQAIVNFTVGIHYQTHFWRKPVLGLQYQQRLQTPFVQSYVPILPYNSLQLGFSLPLKTTPQ